jgi:hypothetical protein
MSYLLSSAKILVYNENRQVKGWYSVPGPYGENIDLRDKLFYYFSCVGAIAYEEYNDSIRWLINNEWFNSNQIERMIKLKVFG